MRLRIEIKTPIGQALATARKIKPFILGTAKTINKVYANKGDDKIIWIVDGEPREMFRIERNVLLFEKTVGMILSNRTVQALAKLSPDDRKQLRDMLENQTKLRVIKTFDKMPDIHGWTEDSI